MELISKTIHFRLVEISDAKFIHSLRVNDLYNRYISHVDDNVDKQIEWLKEYKKREAIGKEYYFIIQRNLDNKPIGTVRLYDFLEGENSFCWGSWILNEDKTHYSALESALIIYDFAFLELGFHRCHMDIRKQNSKAVQFHKKFGVKIIAESDIDYFGHFFVEDYLKIRDDLKVIINKI